MKEPEKPNLNEKEIAFLKKLTSGGTWLVRDGRVRPPVQDLIDRGYCKTAPERSGPLGIYTGETTIFITEAGCFALKKLQTPAPGIAG